MMTGDKKFNTEGLPVWDLIYGKGKIVRVKRAGGVIEHIEVSFADKPDLIRFYDLDGRCKGTVGSVRTLYYSEPNITADLLPKYFPKYDIGDWYVFYRDSTSDDLVRKVVEENEYRLVLVDRKDDRMFLKHSDITGSFKVDCNF